MAMVMDHRQQQQQTYKHYCRICKKGFGCGQALGGHMRAHGINDDSIGGNNGDQDADDPSGCSEWGPADDRLKRMYALRTKPNRLKSCCVCENCSKEFVSWKSFLEHGKCSSDDEVDANDSFVSSPMSDGDDDGLVRRRGWKRSRSAKSAVAATPLSAIRPSSEEEDLANCLMLLSSALVDPEESCASANKEEDRRHYPIVADVEKYKAPVLQALSPVPKGMFECKACKKAFATHQALGGHRASHKKVKGCFAAKFGVDPDDALLPEEDVIITNDHNSSPEVAVVAAAMAMAIMPFNNALVAVTPLKKSKVHECSICHRQFASGQALGGHKRCHWITPNSGTNPSPMVKLQQQTQQQDPTSNRHANQHGQHQRYELILRRRFNASETLDLNLPASVEAGGDGRVRTQDIRSPLRLDVPAALYLQPWVDHKDKAPASNNNNIVEGSCSVNNNNNVDDEVDSKLKLARLSEPKDINGGREESPWLQVGFGSSGSDGEGSQEPLTS